MYRVLKLAPVQKLGLLLFTRALAPTEIRNTRARETASAAEAGINLPRNICQHPHVEHVAASVIFI